jgi:aconitate hydratase
LGLSGEERYDIAGLSGGVRPGARLTAAALASDGSRRQFDVIARIDTPDEAEYYRHDGILPYMLRRLYETG